MINKIDLYDPSHSEIIHIPKKKFTRFLLEGIESVDDKSVSREWYPEQKGGGDRSWMLAKDVLTKEAFEEAKLKHAIYLENEQGATFHQVQQVINGESKPWNELEELFRRPETDYFYIHGVEAAFRPVEEWTVYRLTGKGLYFEKVVGGEGD